jgi:hypothetical protein
MTAPVTFVVPTHPARGDADDPGSLLGMAVRSIFAQTLQPAGGISIMTDRDGDGAAVTRQRALDTVKTEFVSFLDSDDWLYPHHLATHVRLLTGVTDPAIDVLSIDPKYWAHDVAYSWWGGNRPFPESTHRGLVFNPATPHHITMTLTVRTELAKAAGFDGRPLDPEWAGEDWKFILRLCELGARFVGTGEETWHYRVHGANTSGLPHRGDGPMVTP